MQPYVIELGCCTDAAPGLLKVDEMLPGLLSTNNVWVAFQPWKGVQHVQCGRVQANGLPPRLGVRGASGSRVPC